MQNRDQISKHYSDILDGMYECVDRIVINGYFSLGYNPGGFRQWWRMLKGSDDNLDTNHLMRMAGRFSRRIRAFTDSSNIPLIYCKPKERKHEIAEKYIPVNKPGFTGIFLILVSKASALVWDVKRFANGSIDLRRKDPYPFVNHYSFHIMDKDWGHITIRMSGHPPFGVQVILNGHEWVEREAIKNKIQITKEGNCFTSFIGSRKLGKVAETLFDKGHLPEICDRWVYSCLWFGLSKEEQECTGFRYKYSVFQAEISRNYLFQRGRDLDVIYQNIIDVTRSRLDIKKIKTIFGYKHRPKKNKASFRISVEKPSYNMTVFKIQDSRITVKIYDKGERVLRIEVVCHNVRRLNCRRGIENFPNIISILKKILMEFIDAIYLSHVSFLDKGDFDKISKPSKKGKNRVAGINTDNPRCQAVMKSLLELSMKCGGFTSSDLAEKVRKKICFPKTTYSTRKAGYDLRKFKGKSLVKNQYRKRKYYLTPKGFMTIIVLSVIRENILKPIYHGMRKKRTQKPPKNMNPVDQLYLDIKEKLSTILNIYGVIM